jgi:hypothetical protein
MFAGEFEINEVKSMSIQLLLSHRIALLVATELSLLAKYDWKPTKA